ncbi:hypothetical protein SCAR479_00961 [Seiridium cardinale]|uniref:LIM zinc-binding domain-containing protein n=1 Tax=Seiridium cardinale TaxID=138064 RepID=A0ABR2Y7B1_9PEZI
MDAPLLAVTHNPSAAPSATPVLEACLRVPSLNGGPRCARMVRTDFSSRDDVRFGYQSADQSIVAQEIPSHPEQITLLFTPARSGISGPIGRPAESDQAAFSQIRTKEQMNERRVRDREESRYNVAGYEKGSLSPSDQQARSNSGICITVEISLNLILQNPPPALRLSSQTNSTLIVGDLSSDSTSTSRPRFPARSRRDAKPPHEGKLIRRTHTASGRSRASRKGKDRAPWGWLSVQFATRDAATAPNLLTDLYTILTTRRSLQTLLTYQNGVCQTSNPGPSKARAAPVPVIVDGRHTQRKQNPTVDTIALDACFGGSNTRPWIGVGKEEKSQSGSKMAAYRESSFMPTVKCSQCGNEVEISMMGEHVCKGAPATDQPLPAAAPPDLLTGAFASLKQTVWGFGSRAAPPTVDTSVANEAYARPDQLTPVSASTGSRTISPKTPNGRLGAGPTSDDYFSPAIADTMSPGSTGRLGGYGGFADPQPYEPEPMYYGSSPKTQPPQPQAAPSLLQRMNTIAPGPFDVNRRPKAKNAFAPKNDSAPQPDNYTDDIAGNGYGIERPSTAASYASNNSGVMAPPPPRVPRKNGYGGFGPADQEQDENFEPRPFGVTQRSETFPKQSQGRYEDVPVRPPSAPGMRQEHTRRPTNESMNRDREQRPSTSMRDTSRAPPPRKSLVRPTTSGRAAPSVNLADEFGVSNPYHTPTGSQSSSNSGYSASQPSQASSNSSPARSMGSRRQPSDTSNIDALMSDLQTSMSSLKPDFSNPRAPPAERSAPSRSERRARPEDMRFDTAVQGMRGSRPRSPLASPPESYSDRVDPAIQGGRSRSPARAPHLRQPSTGRSRGNCKACKLPITGKSISSADGRLTGRYHKACFVCTTCQSPFTSAEFYVLNDKPYDSGCYHRLNGSLCTTCGVGIEGQYLEDDSAHKHHPGCFRCGDCGMALQDGYFEVNGKAYCERDAWKRVQQPVMAPIPYGRSGMAPQPSSRLGLPNGSRLAPPGLRPRMEKRMTRLGMI